MDPLRKSFPENWCGRRPAAWTSLFLLSMLSIGARAQEILPIPPELEQSIQSVMCLPRSAISPTALATTERLVLAGPGIPRIRPRMIVAELGEKCVQGDYVAFTVEVAVYPDAARGDYEKVGPEYVEAMCSTTPGVNHPYCGIGTKAKPAPNTYYRNFGMEGVRTDQLPRGGGRIFAGLGDPVTVDNVTTFASYDEGPRFARGRFYVWEVCRFKFRSPAHQNSDGQIGATECRLVDVTDPLPMGSTAEGCMLSTGTAQIMGYCVSKKTERLATPSESAAHIKGVLDAQCRGRRDDDLNLCHVVHTDKYIVVAQSLETPFIVQPYGTGTKWGYVGADKVVGDRIYPMSSHKVAAVTSKIYTPGGVEVDDDASAGLPGLNKYESQDRPVPPSSPTAGSVTPMPGSSPGAQAAGSPAAPSPGGTSCSSGVWIPMVGCRG